MIRVFIGYDPVEAGTYGPMVHSILRQSSMPVSITPVALENLRGILTRERDPMQSNDFAFSRFLVPWMCNYEGWAIFMDCDMILRDDIAKLWAQRDEKYAIKVVKHNHVPPEDTKYLGNKQTKYARKNWSSVMLINCAKCKLLTPEYINTASGLDLHQFKWLEDHEIGELPHYWNHLVGYDAYDPRAANVHYTTGGPYFAEYKNCDYHQDWYAEKSKSEIILQTSEIKKSKLKVLERE